MRDQPKKPGSLFPELDLITRRSTLFHLSLRFHVYNCRDPFFLFDLRWDINAGAIIYSVYDISADAYRMFRLLHESAYVKTKRFRIFHSPDCKVAIRFLASGLLFLAAMTVMFTACAGMTCAGVSRPVVRREHHYQTSLLDSGTQCSYAEIASAGYRREHDEAKLLHGARDSEPLRKQSG
jgi:hypothetical protein